MITRLALAALIAAAAAGSAFALVAPAEVTSLNAPANETIIIKTQDWQIFNSLTVEECETETCEDNAS